MESELNTCHKAGQIDAHFCNQISNVHWNVWWACHATINLHCAPQIQVKSSFKKPCNITTWRFINGKKNSYSSCKLWHFIWDQFCTALIDKGLELNRIIVVPIKFLVLTDSADTRLTNSLLYPCTSATTSAMSARDTLSGPPKFKTRCIWLPSVAILFAIRSSITFTTSFTYMGHRNSSQKNSPSPPPESTPSIHCSSHHALLASKTPIQDNWPICIDGIAYLWIRGKCQIIERLHPS